MKNSSSPKNVIPANAHTIFSFNLPYAIPISDGIYKMKIRTGSADIAIKRVQRTDIAGFQVSGSGFAQIRFDKYGRFSFSFVQIKVPQIMKLSEKGRPPLLLGGIPPRNKAKEVVLRFLNRFIETVRYVTEEYWVEPARYQDILSFDVSYWDGKVRYPAGIEMLDTGVGGMGFGTGDPFHIGAEKMQNLKVILENDIELETIKIFLLNSKDACLQEDFRLAIIEAVTALEMILYRFTRIQGEKLGISKGNLEKFIVDVGLTGNISVVLKMLTKDLEQIDDKIVQKCKGAITTRNSILHEGLREISPTDTEEEIIAIERMIAYLYRLLALIQFPKT